MIRSDLGSNAELAETAWADRWPKSFGVFRVQTRIKLVARTEGQARRRMQEIFQFIDHLRLYGADPCKDDGDEIVDRPHEAVVFVMDDPDVFVPAVDVGPLERADLATLAQAARADSLVAPRGIGRGDQPDEDGRPALREVRTSICLVAHSEEHAIRRHDDLMAVLNHLTRLPTKPFCAVRYLFQTGVATAAALLWREEHAAFPQDPMISSDLSFYWSWFDPLAGYDPEAVARDIMRSWAEACHDEATE
jgi:hypothetical protein